MVPTVERVVLTELRCSIAMAGGIPSMLSTCGLSIRSKNCRAYGEKVSIYLRWPSANKVSKASELFPEPLKPVMTINCLSGRSRSKFFRLLWRTPFRRITDRADDFNIFKQQDKIAPGGLQVCEFEIRRCAGSGEVLRRGECNGRAGLSSV